MHTLVNSDLIVISDVHLRTADDARGSLLIALLGDLAAAKVKNVVLLGDIFDFCFGRKTYFCEKFRPIGQALSALAGSGAKVYFFEGNHEFDVSYLPWQRVEFVSEGSRVLTLAEDMKVVLAHGDLVYSDAAYRMFRGFVKSRIVRFLAIPFSARMLDWYALHHANVSRAGDQYRKLKHTDLIRTAHQWRAAHGAKVGVIGHFHTPYHEPDSGNLLLSVRSWDEPNFLQLKADKIARGVYNSKSGMWDLSESLPSDYTQRDPQ